MSDSPPPCCLHCRYELSGFAVGDTCPECGTRVLTVAEDQDVPTAVAVSIFAGSTGALCLGLAIAGLFYGSFGLVWFALLWLLSSAIGLIYAVWAAVTIRRNPRLTSRRTIVASRIGFSLLTVVPVMLIVLAIFLSYFI